MIRSYLALLRDERPVLLFGIGCAFLSSPGQTFFISLFVGVVASSLGLGAAQLGSLYLVGTLGAASLLPLAGHWLDRLDLRRYTLLVMGGLAVACGVMALANGPIGVILGFLMLRLTGQGLMTHVAAASVARYFDRFRGRALSIVALGFPLAEGILPAVAVAMIAGLGWRMTYGLIGAVVLFIAAPVLVRLIWRAPAFTRPPAWRKPGKPPRALDGLKIVVATRFFWCALPILLFMPFTSTALIFHIQVIAAAKGWTSELVALSFTGYAIGHTAGLLLSGGVVDRLGARNMLALMNLPMMTGIAILGLFDAEPALLAFLALAGASSGLVHTSGSAVWAEVYGTAQLGTIRSFGVMLMVGGTALGPAAIGFLLDGGTPVGGVCGYLIAAGLAAALLAAIDARRRSAPR
ncbi:MAG: MFS transporter [Rhodospirillales bacterium]|nr:MFS transporter [Rhodospirillales bacterium]